MIDFTDSIDASKFEMEASKCKTKEDRIKFCREYLNKSGYIMSYPEKKKDLNNPIPLPSTITNTDWMRRKDRIPETLEVVYDIDHRMIEDISHDRLLENIQKSAGGKLMTEIMKKGYVKITDLS